jgi:Zn-dependent protease
MTGSAYGVDNGSRRTGGAVRPSPVFLAIVACFAVFGAIVWTSGFATGRGYRLAVFAFVVSGWLISLCLHEFGHAYTAWRYGDHTVAVRGYLTLNPARYVDAGLSIVLPMIFLVAGGIGLPGGAVYIDRGAIRGKWRHSFVSAIGPLLNLVLAVVLAVLISKYGRLSPYSYSPNSGVGHLTFWAALSFLAFLQLTAAVFNFFPVPGLDGFGIWEPWLPRSFAAAASRVGPIGYVILIGLLWIPSVNRAFFDGIFHLTDALGINGFAIDSGRALFEFWSS